MAGRKGFEPVKALRTGGAEVKPFVSKALAARRAAFLIQSIAAEPPPVPSAPEPVVEREPEVILETAEQRQAREQQALQLLIDQAEQRGRLNAMTELGVALDALAQALESAGQQLQAKQLELQRLMVAPLAKSAVQLAEQLARQQLFSPEGLAAYVEAVMAAVPGNAAPTDPPYTVLMNPDDLQTLGDRAVALASLRVLPDPLVARGGISLRQLDEVLEDQFSTRLREVREAALAVAAQVAHSPNV
mgnify:CR=1 FL=1